MVKRIPVCTGVRSRTEKRGGTAQRIDKRRVPVNLLTRSIGLPRTADGVSRRWSAAVQRWHRLES